MDASAILHDYLYNEPEHPVPHTGEVVHLVYPPKEGTVGVTVVTAPDNTAVFTVVVPAADLAAAVAESRMAAARSMGGAQTPGAIEGVRRQVGEEAFDARVGNMARLYFLSVAMMRTHIFPFLAPEILPSPSFVPGRDYAFQARMLLRPQAGLGSYDPVHVKLPEKPQVSDRDVDNQMNLMMGGDVPWDEVDAIANPAYAQMRQQVRERMEAEQLDAWSDRAIEACEETLSSRLDTVPPQRHIELLRNQMANSFAAGVEREGTSWEDYTASPDYSEEEFKAACTANALRSLRHGMALDAMADHLGLIVTEDEVMSAVSEVAPGHEREALQGMLQTGQLPQLCETTRRIKCGNFLLNHAVQE